MTMINSGASHIGCKYKCGLRFMREWTVSSWKERALCTHYQPKTKPPSPNISTKPPRFSRSIPNQTNSTPLRALKSNSESRCSALLHPRLQNFFGLKATSRNRQRPPRDQKRDWHCQNRPQPCTGIGHLWQKPLIACVAKMLPESLREDVL